MLRALTLTLLGAACSAIAVAQPPPPPPPQAPARDTPALATGTAIIRGRVTDTAGRPLARAEIRIGNGSGQQKNGLTDPDGRFDLGELPAGTYTAFASKTNYIRQGWGEQRPEGPGKRITLADGQRLDNINF